jgi:hypothetical protein
LKKKVGFEFAIDDLKAIKIAGRLHNQFYSRQGFFADYSMPEYVLPRNLKQGLREHALSRALETRRKDFGHCLGNFMNQFGL